MKPILILCLVFLCFLKCEGRSFAGFIDNFSDHIGHAFSIAWESVIDAVKQPVKTHRLGPQRPNAAYRQRRRMIPASTITTTMTTTEEEEYVTTTPSTPKHKLELPLIPRPRFYSMSEWDILQRPRYSYKERVDEPAIMFLAPEIKEPKPNSFGPLMFIK